MEFQPFSFLLTDMTRDLLALIEGMWSVIASPQTYTFLMVAVIISVGLKVIQALRGNVAAPASAIGWQLIRYAIAITVFGNYVFFETYVLLPFWHGPNIFSAPIVNAFSASGATTVHGQLDAMVLSYWDAIGAVARHGGLTNPWPLCIAIMLLLGGIAFFGYILVLVVIARVMMAILLSLSLVAVVFWLFTRTGGVFVAWIRQCANYAFLLPITYIFLYAMLGSFEASILAYNEWATTTEPGGRQFASLSMRIIVGLVILTQLYNVSTAIMGGLSLSGERFMGRAKSHIKNAPEHIREARDAGAAGVRGVRAVANRLTGRG